MWSLGTLIAFPACVIVTIALVVAGFVFRSRMLNEPEDKFLNDRGLFRGLSWGAFGLALVVGILTAGSMYPYNADYHKWENQSGTVAKVSARFLGDGDKGTTQRFVVKFTDGRERSCDDTRCSLVEVGDRLTLSCKRHWQYAGEDGWDCNYIRRAS